MRLVLLATAVLLSACDSKEKVYSKYLAEVSRDNIAYTGNSAEAAYEAKLRYLGYVRKLQSENAPISIPYDDIYIWDYARLGLLAEHLGRQEDASHFFRLAVGYAKKRYPYQGEDKTGEAALRSVLDRMDSPDRIAWRRH